MKKIRKSVISILLLTSLVTVMVPVGSVSAATKATASQTDNTRRVIFIMRKLPRIASQNISKYTDITIFIGTALILHDQGIVKDPVYVLAKQAGMRDAEAQMVSTGLTPLLNLQ